MRKMLMIIGLIIAGAVAVVFVRDRRSGSDDSLQDVTEEARHAASKASDAAREAAAAVKHKASRAVEAVRDRTDDAVASLKGIRR